MHHAPESDRNETPPPLGIRCDRAQPGSFSSTLPLVSFFPVTTILTPYPSTAGYLRSPGFLVSREVHLTLRPWTCCPSLPDAAGHREESLVTEIMFGGRGDMDKRTHRWMCMHRHHCTCTPRHARTHTFTLLCTQSFIHTHSRSTRINVIKHTACTHTPCCDPLYTHHFCGSASASSSSFYFYSSSSFSSSFSPPFSLLPPPLASLLRGHISPPTPVKGRGRNPAFSIPMSLWAWIPQFSPHLQEE